MLLEGHGEGHRRHGQQLARDPQGRDADDGGDDATGHGRQGQGQEQVQVEVVDEVGRHHAAHADQGDLAQAHRATPAGEHHQRHGDHGVDEGHGAGADLRRAAGEGDEDERAGDGEGHDDAGGAQLGQGRQPGGQPVGQADRRPRPLAGVGATDGALLEEEAGDDDGQQHHVAPRPGREVDLDELVDDLDGDAGEEGAPERAHPGDHGGGQRGEEDGGPRGGVDGQALDRGLEHDGEGRQPADDGPQLEVQPVDGDAEQPGPVDVLGQAPDGGARLGAVQVEQQAGEGHRGQGGEDHVVAVEAGAAHPPGGVREARVEARDGGGDVEPVGDEQGQPAEGLGQPDGGDGEDEAGGGAEPADDRHLDAHPQPHAQGDAQRGDDPPAPAQAEGEAGGEGAARRAHGAVGEVDDPGRAVDEHQADGHEPGADAEGGALEHDADLDVVEAGEAEGEDGQEHQPRDPQVLVTHRRSPRVCSAVLVRRRRVPPSPGDSCASGFVRFAHSPSSSSSSWSVPKMSTPSPRISSTSSRRNRFPSPTLT